MDVKSEGERRNKMRASCKRWHQRGGRGSCRVSGVIYDHIKKIEVIWQYNAYSQLADMPSPLSLLTDYTTASCSFADYVT